MTRHPVNSSSIRSIGHENGVMHIEFKNGQVYEYTGPKVAEHYAALQAAESVGRYFSAVVANCPHTLAQRL